MSPPASIQGVTIASDGKDFKITTPAKFVAIGIIAISAGLCVPLAMARKRTMSPTQSLNSSAPSLATPTTLNPARLLGRHAGAPSGPRTVETLQKAKIKQATEALEFNPALYTFSAFGAATAMVWTAAGVGVYAVHRITGATTMEEFSIAARGFVHARLPWLGSKLYGQYTGNDSGSGDWNWEEAEKRLEAAYETGGLSRWAEQALEEFKRENEAARQRSAGLVDATTSN